MSKVEELLAKYNPNGVFQSDLREVSSIMRGKRVTKRDVKESGDYPVISGGESPMGYYDTFNRDANTITIAQYGAAGYVDFQKNKFWANDVCYSILPFESVDNKYLYYTLKSKQNFIYSIRNTDAVPFSLPINTLYSIQIPLPHIKVQEEIVKILDSFTNLIDALNEELSLRQKQFEYYREKLLTFDDNHDSISSVTMDDLFNFKNGYTPSTKNSEYWTNGEVNWFTVADFKKNNNVLYDSIKKVSISAVKGGKLFKPNSILLATTATIGIHALIRTEHLSNQQLTNLSLKKEYVDKIDIKYIYYYMFLIDEWCKKNYHGGGFMIVDMVGLKKQQIPIPSFSIQQSIVEKLDAFESLISSLKEEIALRQKQYEYYREKLLTFD